MGNTTVELYSKIKPSEVDEDVCVMIADWGFKAGHPNMDNLWIVDDGAWFLINDPGCFICWIKGTIGIAAENNQTMVIDDSIKMLLLAVINHKRDGDFPDELYFYSAPALLDWVIVDSGHDESETM